MVPNPGAFSFTAHRDEAGMRLDAVLVLHLEDLSRSEANRWVRNGLVRVNDLTQKPGYRVRQNDHIRGEPPEPHPVTFEPEPIDFQILYQDDALVVVNKPPDLVVHPAPGHYSGTLVNGLLHRFPELRSLGEPLRPGIVHRLDKDTSGALIVAKSLPALNRLGEQFQSRRIKKTYLALIFGQMPAPSGSIDFPIGRHPVDRKKMSIHSRKPRHALTHWKLKRRFEGISFIELDIETGRTHQIRVHCSAMGHPVVGDTLYSGHQMAKASPGLKKRVSRQMLHAWKIKFWHPVSDEEISIEAPLPEDMATVLGWLKGESAVTGHEAGWS
jgi:23S rRNA pseudouridine1911/1915/1917 synthase